MRRRWKECHETRSLTANRPWVKTADFDWVNQGLVKPSMHLRAVKPNQNAFQVVEFWFCVTRHTFDKIAYFLMLFLPALRSVNASRWLLLAASKVEKLQQMMLIMAARTEKLVADPASFCRVEDKLGLLLLRQFDEIRRLDMLQKSTSDGLVRFNEYSNLQLSGYRILWFYTNYSDSIRIFVWKVSGYK